VQECASVITVRLLIASITSQNGADSADVARRDELMQQLMGVSNAILENVIFCHQLDAK
jgi:DNA repair exonuclease SbcCD ATPase subunit